MKKTILFLAEALALAVCFTLVLWFFHAIGLNDSFQFKKVALEGILFGIFYTPVSWWLEKRNKK